MYLENLSAEIMGKFDSGQKLFSRKDVEILLARIQQLEIAAQQSVQADTRHALDGTVVSDDVIPF